MNTTDRTLIKFAAYGFGATVLLMALVMGGAQEEDQFGAFGGVLLLGSLTAIPFAATFFIMKATVGRRIAQAKTQAQAVRIGICSALMSVAIMSYVVGVISNGYEVFNNPTYNQNQDLLAITFNGAFLYVIGALIYAFIPATIFGGLLGCKLYGVDRPTGVTRL